MPIWTGAINTDWGTSGNWAIDGSGNTGVPLAGTDAIFNAGSSNPCTTGTAIRTCRDLITTGYTGTLQIGSSTAGILRVVRNVTLGSQVGHITGLAYLHLFAASGSVTLDVPTGVVIPNLTAFPNANFTLGVVLARTTVVTNFSKTGTSGSNVNFTSGGGSVELQITNMKLTTTGNMVFAVNTALRFMGSATYDSFVFGGGSMILDAGATLTPIITESTTTPNIGVTVTLGGTVNANFSAGTLIYPALSITNRAGTYLSLGAGAMTFNFGSNTVDNITIGALPNALAVVLQSDLVVNRTFAPGFGVLFTGGFNLIVKETLGRNIGLIRNNAGGKIIYQGTSNGFIGTGYISGNTFHVVSVIQGSLSTNSVIHAPSVSTAVNYISGVTTFETTYSVTTSQTIGSIGSPVMFYGFGIGNLNLGEAVGSNVVLEIDAGSNDVYLMGAVAINGSTTEIRYLNTNTGIFEGSKGGITITAQGGIIDFQDQSSLTKFIGSLSNNGFFSFANLKSDLYVNTLSINNGSGILQTGSRVIYVSGNLSANTGNGTGGGGQPIYPRIELIGAANCNFTCFTLNANLRINKDPLAVVTFTQSFNYGTSIGSPYTFEHQNGILDFGATVMTVLSSTVLNTPDVIFNQIIFGASATTTNLLATLKVNNTIQCLGAMNFVGFGWECNDFLHPGSNLSIILQAESHYKIDNFLRIVGTSGLNAGFRSSNFSSFNGTIAGTNLTVTGAVTGSPISVGQTISHESLTIPEGLQNLLPDRPTIVSGSGLNWVLDLPVSPNISVARLLGAGKKAILTLANTATYDVGYVSVKDIDSSQGQQILAFGSSNDVTILRTENWGPLLSPTPYTIGTISIR
jgi:hypothetical protein